MKEKRILNVLGQVDEKFVEEAAPADRAGKKRGWVKWGAIAACVALAAAIGIPAARILISDPSADDPSGVSAPPVTVDADKITYQGVSADWPFYLDVPSLVDESSLIVVGNVTGVTFQVLDSKTAQPATEETAKQDRSLNTIYEIEVIEQYKGDPVETTQMRVLGGLEGVYLEEQVAALGNEIKNGITILEGVPEIKVGETYLFALYQYGDTAPTLLNPAQSVYALDGQGDPSLPFTAEEIMAYFD